MIGGDSQLDLTSLASLVALTPDWPAFARAYPGDAYAMTSTTVQAVIAIYGAYDLPAWQRYTLGTTNKGSLEQFLGGAPDQVPGAPPRMDNLTHALSGALLAKAVAPSHIRPGSPSLGQRMLASTVATGVVPDLDFVVTWISPLSYLFHHRGVTHSLVMLPLWAVLLGALWSWLHARNLRLWRDYAGIFAMGIALHIAGDVITSYGTQVFAPLSNVRYTLSTTFIIDLWLMALLAAGLAIALYFRRSRLPAVLACMAVVAYVGFQSQLRERALETGELAGQDHESCTRKLGGGLEVHQAHGLAELEVLAPTLSEAPSFEAALLDVVVLVLADRHALMRDVRHAQHQVGQARLDLAELFRHLSLEAFPRTHVR